MTGPATSSRTGQLVSFTVRVPLTANTVPFGLMSFMSLASNPMTGHRSVAKKRLPRRSRSLRRLPVPRPSASSSARMLTGRPPASTCTTARSSGICLVTVRRPKFRTEKVTEQAGPYG